MIPRPLRPPPISERSRIEALPRRIYDGSTIRDRFRFQPFKDPSGSMIRELKQDQLAALEAIQEGNGGLIIVGVGGGKAGVALLAGAVLEAKCALILTPASTVTQLQVTLAVWRQHFDLPQTRILSYSALSSARTSDQSPILDEILSGFEDHEIVIVADECHSLKDFTAARTKRIARFFEDHQNARFVGLSGTITRKSIKDFAHLADWALRKPSPVPRNSIDLNNWATCLDVDGQPGPLDWTSFGVALPERGKQEAARIWFRDRLATAPGIHTSTQTSVDCSLTIIPIKSVKIPSDLKELIRIAEVEGIDYDGVPFPDQISRWRALKELATGFIYRWAWPMGCPYCGCLVGSKAWKGHCVAGADHKDPDRVPDEPWLKARSAWASAVRRELETRSAHGYDSESLVRFAAITGTAPHLKRVWEAWETESVKPDPPIETVWIDYYLIEDAVKRCRYSKDPIILWYESKAVGSALARAGLTVYGAGNNPPVGVEAHTCAMSIAAQGTGLNLQRWSKNLVIEPPSGGATWEQMLGRTHRSGQDQDDVEVYVYSHARPFKEAFRSARLDARYIEDSTGNIQRLNIASGDFERDL